MVWVCCMLCCLGWLGGSGSAWSIGVLNVTCLGCCLFNAVRISNVAVAASMGTLNLRIPR